jgi:hypothetical protein
VTLPSPESPQNVAAFARKPAPNRFWYGRNAALASKGMAIKGHNLVPLPAAD